MKVLQATSLSQGQRDDDFNFCFDGELLVLPLGVHDRETADGPCGCKRALGGAVSLRATTTAVVVETTQTEEEWLRCVAESFVAGGWWNSPAEVDESLLATHRDLLAAVQNLPAGTVVEFRDSRLVVRELRQ